ncbi:Tetraketide alpha-pyrone reductase 1 [Morella rubra]|uniref:Tetraketide alpha-pyrone reductase 1 n=1 Tax=Morella rubra TaxID=262757 RepID=A0A6A1WHV0_9ROSI|nr:Tetraketide alpha-pyrone reductase 1 [Morella rubra]
MSSGAEQVVCVTGASGYIASWLVKLLLQSGYTVKAAGFMGKLYFTDDPKKTEHLLALDGAKERLKLVKAILLEEGSLDSLVDGCQGVFHTASPVVHAVSDPQLWYQLSKTLAEEAAWKCAAECGIDLVTIHPGFVIGPLIQSTPTSSIDVFLKVMNGTQTFPDGVHCFVDVRDVALAHLQAFEAPTAKGRYCLVESVTLYSEAFKILHNLYPSLCLPENCSTLPEPTIVACNASRLKVMKSELIDPAVKGTLNVLRSCAKVPSIKRVVITASVASVMFNGKPLTPDVVIDETWFSDTVRCEELKNWYAISKTLAEESAWKFSEDHGIDLVAICPGFVIGPLLQPAPTSSIEGFLNLVKGTQTFPDGIYRFVDIRNVVDAHIQAFETPAASGRYCVVGRVVHYSEAFKILQKICPSLHLPEKFEDDKPSLPVYKVSQDRARSLGINFIPLEVSLRDTVESLKEKGFLIF